MNDRSTEIVGLVEAALKAKFPTITVTTAKLSSSQEKFPCAYLRFEFPSETPGTHDTSGTEVWTRTRCTADAYSRTSLHEAKSIIALMDAEMGRLGFQRSNWTEVPCADESIRRVQASWQASVDASGNVAAW